MNITALVADGLTTFGAIAAHAFEQEPRSSDPNSEYVHVTVFCHRHPPSVGSLESFARLDDAVIAMSPEAADYA